MRAVTCCWFLLLVVGCKPADKPGDTTMADAPSMAEAPAMAEPPGAISLADVAGTWKVSSTVEGSSSPTVTYEMVTTADRSGWSINFPNRKPVPVRVIAVEGDSIVSEAGPFESVLRKGVQV